MTKTKTTTKTTAETDTRTATQPLYTKAGGQRAHLRGCPHIVGLEVARLPDGDTSLPACRWTWTELNNVGRIPQKSVDSALRELGASPTDRPQMVKLLKGVARDDVHLPPSRAYVALSLDGLAVAWAGKTYVQIGEEFDPLPSHRAGTTEVSELWGEPCDQCFQERARNGTCNCG